MNIGFALCVHVIEDCVFNDIQKYNNKDIFAI